MRIVKWEASKEANTNGEDLLLGKYAVGGYRYDGALPKGSDGPFYRVTCKLPGIKSFLGHAETTQAARDMLEQAVRHWQDKANLKSVDGLDAAS
jgi:hypothetical protein